MKKLELYKEIYTYQIDAAGHVSNIVYIQWMEECRLKLLEEIGLPAHKVIKGGVIPVLVEPKIKYKKALYLGEKVKIEVWISELKNVSALIEYRFYNSKNELASVASQVGLFVNSSTIKPHRLTPEEREAFTKFLMNDD
jgi:acyl-CoA thioester hydrolase